MNTQNPVFSRENNAIPFVNGRKILWGSIDRSYLKSFIQHVMIWILYFFYENGVMLIINPKGINLTSTLLFFLLNALIFYINSFVLIPLLAYKKRYYLLVLATVFLAGLYLLLNYCLTDYMKRTNIPTVYAISSVKQYLALRLTRFVYFISVSYAYSFAAHTIQINKELVQLEKLRNEELQKRSLLEKEVLISNLNYLRYQIQPHFLFNTLSFIYTQVMKCSQSASRSVMLLSDIMRYALHDPDDGKTALETEVQHIHNLIEIHQLRFNNSLNIEFESENDYAFKYRRIVPMLLITFVENLFKYGDVNDPLHPAKIKVNFLEDELHFHTYNRKKTGVTNMISSGIGLANVKKRLALAYGNNKYQLLIDDKDEFYTVDLTLKL